SLFLGIFLAFVNNKFTLKPISVNGSNFLKAGIICLGGTISLKALGDISTDYIPMVSLYVLSIMIFGTLLGKLIKLPRNLTLLLVSGTAICGGTAIASLAPIIKAKSEDLVASISLVFLLNAIAIILFPYIGEYYEMTNEEFGIFSALTIHDTASVVGTASLYSDESVTYASITKLGRTLWIVPLLIGASIYTKSDNKDYEFPYFILVFLAFVIIGNTLGVDEEIKSIMKRVSIALFQIGLFMIGYKFQLNTILNLSIKPVLFAVSIWITIIALTLLVFHV
ncbi:MAG TPA: putative sulfate exporter family transporter, partial [Gammaproteobacteria bacterium]|nr:putative sulfate exporter family transporter [Gammaproteobacteria bacterium]